MRHASGVLLLLLLLGILGVPGRAADEEATPLEGAVGRLWSAASDADAERTVAEILALAPAPDDLLEALGDPRPQSAAPAEPGWSIRRHVWPDGVERAYHLYVPESYARAAGTPDGADPASLLFHLHGGVSRPEPIATDDEGFLQYRDWWKDVAEARRMFVVFPLGEAAAPWWTEGAAAALEAIARDLRRRYAIDENRVFVTGFSDGGSGSWYLAMSHPTVWAGFIPLNGHPAVASAASGRQLYPVNVGLRPLYVVNTQDDPLYPTVSVLPFIERMMRSGAQIRFTSYPGIGHTPAYRDEQDRLIGDWIDATERDPLPADVDFETADLDAARAVWVTILALGPGADDADLPDVNVMSTPGRVLVGITIDPAFEGEGVRVEEVRDGSLAQTLGLLPGDVIVGAEGRPVASLGDLRAVLQEKDWGDAMQLAWTRGDERHEADGMFPPFTPEPTFLRDRASGRIEVRTEGNRVDVRTRGVRRYALDLSPDLFDLDQPVTVTTNGTTSFDGVPKTDLAHLLHAFARDRDPSMLFPARLEVEVPAPEPQEDGSK